MAPSRSGRDRAAAAVAGAAAGLALAAGLTLVRRVSWTPWLPVWTPLDAALLAGGLALALLVCGGRGAGAWLALAATALFVGVTPASGTPARMLLAGGALLGGAGVAWALRPGARAALPFGAAAGGLALALPLAWQASTLHAAAWLLLPLAALAVGVAGVARPPGSLARAGALLGVGALALGVAARPSPPRYPPPAGAGRPGPSVVLVVLDTLRRDHVSLYGYARPTTPHLDAWARDALVFEEASAASSWTLPSHASLFTGLPPRSHGAHGYRGQRPDSNVTALPPSHETLAERARRAGVATGAVVANPYLLSPELGIAQGFETYELLKPRRGARFLPSERLLRRLAPAQLDRVAWPYVRAPFVTDRAVAWLRAHAQRPFFLFLNYMDVHRPNRQPPDAVVPWEDEIDVPGFYPRLQEVLEGEPLDPRLRRSLVNAYDRELRALDRELGRLLDFLAESGLGERTTVIVTSDHGEYFGEHAMIDHMMGLYAEVVNVPLLVKGPGIAPGRVRRPVQGVDVFPTVLEGLGLDPSGAHAGVSLLRARSAPEGRPIVSEWFSAANGRLREPRFGDRFEDDLITLRQRDLRLFEERDGDVELYDLRRDPYETRDLAAERPDDVARLREALEAWRRRHPRRDGPPLESTGPPPDLPRSQLEALGYAR
jgi:arylsulfatase A-like enzyme